MRVNPFRPYRPATCSGKALRPAALAIREHHNWWAMVKTMLRSRKAKQKAAREKRGHGLPKNAIPTAVILRKPSR